MSPRLSPAPEGAPLTSAPRRFGWTVRLALLLLIAAMALLGGQGEARAQSGEVRLVGSNDNNWFRVEAAGAQLRFSSDRTPAFTRDRGDVERIIVEGLDGDDTLIITHSSGSSGFVNTTSGPLTITYDAGPGADELDICESACDPGVNTDVSLTPEADEIRVVQCLDADRYSARCLDDPNSSARVLAMTVRGTRAITDQSKGPLTVVGSPSGDDVTIGNGPTAGVGEVRVNASPAIRYTVKDHLTVATGAGADTIHATGDAGLTDTGTCAQDFSSGPPLCVLAGTEGGDHLILAPGPGAEAITMSSRPPFQPWWSPTAVSRLSGFGVLPNMDVGGVDVIDLPQQPSDGDTFTISGTPLEERFRIDNTARDRATVTGTLATNSTGSDPAHLPSVVLSGDGSGPLFTTVHALGQADALTVGSGAADDLIGVGPLSEYDPTVPSDPNDPNSPPLPRTACEYEASSATVGTCSQISHDGHLAHTIWAIGLETLDVSTGDGADELAVAGNLAPQLTWRGGEGPDRLTFNGTGESVAVDFGANTVAQDGAAGRVTATELETIAVDVAGRSLRVLGSPLEDTFTYTPSGEQTGSITREGDARRLDASGVAGLLTIDPGEGGDTVMVRGRNAEETIQINRQVPLPASGEFIGRDARTVTSVGDLLPLVSSDATESLEIDGRAGDDEFFVTGEGDASLINLVGGVHHDGDSLTFALSESEVEVRFGDYPASGVLYAGGSPITFQGIEHVDTEGDGTGSLTVEGTGGSDTITQQGTNISSSNGTSINVVGYPQLYLDGGHGDDDIYLSPRTLPNYVTNLFVDGGEGTDVLHTLGSALRETIVYEALGHDSALIEMSLAPTILMSTTESVELDGGTTAPSGDNLVVRSPDIDGTVVVAPGTANDAGSVSLGSASAGVSSFPTLYFGRIGRGDVIIDGGDFGGAPVDAALLLGQTDGDVVDVTTNGTGGSTVTIDARVPVITTSVHTITLQTGEGHDSVHVPATHGVVGAEGPAIIVDGGPPSGGDVLVIDGVDAQVTNHCVARSVTNSGHRPIAYSGFARVDLDAGGQSTVVQGGAGPDTLAVIPTSPEAAIVACGGVPTVLHLTNALSLKVDGSDGADTATVSGRSIAEDIHVARATVTTVSVGDLMDVHVGETAEAIRVEAHEGRDTITVTGTGGPGSLSLDGGQPALDGDRVIVESSDATAEFASPATSGAVRTDGGDILFSAMDWIEAIGDGTGTVTIAGSDAGDTMTLGDPGDPRVRINDGASMTYTGYPELVVDGRGGTDQTTVSVENLGDIATLSLVGGVGGDDSVTVVDTQGQQRTFEARPTSGDHATISVSDVSQLIDVTGSQRILLNGRSGNDEVLVTSPDGAQNVTVEPGATADSGTVRIGSHIQIGFTGIGLQGSVTLADGSADLEDHVTINGSQASDRFDVDGPSNTIHSDSYIDIHAPGASLLTIRGYDGADRLTATGPLRWATLTFDGGGDGDQVDLHGATADSVVDLEGMTASGFGGIVAFPEVSHLQTSHALFSLTVVGSARDDAMCYYPQSPRDGLIHVVGAPGGGTEGDTCLGDARAMDVLHEFIDVGILRIDPAEGADQVILNGTVDDDDMRIETYPGEIVSNLVTNPATTAEVRLEATLVSDNTEQVVVASDSGSDFVTVATSDAPAPGISVFGEAPNTRNADRLFITDLTGDAKISKQGGENDGYVTVHYEKGSGLTHTIVHLGMEKIDTEETDPPAPPPGQQSDGEPEEEDPAPEPEPDPDPEPEPEPGPIEPPGVVLPPLCVDGVGCAEVAPVVAPSV